jgi:hypothetical protein
LEKSLRPPTPRHSIRAKVIVLDSAAKQHTGEIMGRSCWFSLALSIGILHYIPPAFGQTQYRRFTRTPYYKGPDDPERGKIRGTLKLGETVVIDIPGDTGDTDLKPGVVPDPNVTPPRGSRPGGPFEIEGIAPRDWVAIKIIDVVPGPYGYSNNHSPVRGPMRVLTPLPLKGRSRWLLGQSGCPRRSCLGARM